MMMIELIFHILILISWPRNTSAEAPTITKLPHCTSKCGNVSIPFPFGIEYDCYLGADFAVDCKSSKPFLRHLKLEVLEISLDGILRVNHEVVTSCDEERLDVPYVNLEETPFVYSETRNIFTSLGCNNFAYMSNNETVFSSCISNCDAYRKNKRKVDIAEENGCYGIKCCQTRIPSYFQAIDISLRSVDYPEKAKTCKSAFLVDYTWFATNLMQQVQNIDKVVPNLIQVPVVLEWGIFNYSFDQLSKNISSISNSSFNCSTSLSTDQFTLVQCNCSKGYEGNPYVRQGCQDIDECKSDYNSVCGSDICENIDGSYNCYPHKRSKIKLVIIGIGTSFGGLFLLTGAWWLCIIIKKRKEKKLKEKYFKQNGGLLLQKRLTSSDGSVDTRKLFNSRDLDKATDRFNVDRKIGEGGQGTVYKGMLANGKIVAVKKSKVVDDDRKLLEFINEVVILSEIKHRNIVELLGYCLETEVPLLVYEFIPNGTLFEYLHDPKEEFPPLTWDMRLGIAIEVVDALTYLHSAASMAIYHRDIKSANILLDGKYRAKVADFGIAKSIEIDGTHATTKVVQGTFGYIDPEFLESRQFTDKSDVYGFGVVLIELLTGQKPISSGESFVRKFIDSMKENHLDDILNAQVKDEGKGEEIMAVATVAYKCVKRKGSKRPTMKEVSMELQRIRASENNNLHQNYEEVENMRSEVLLRWDGPSTSTGSTFEVQLTDFQPLLNSI